MKKGQPGAPNVSQEARLGVGGMYEVLNKSSSGKNDHEICLVKIGELGRVNATLKESRCLNITKTRK